ncbi:hypothetical protein [Gulosibacter massiliensis]|uniref:hypothetical protein n=1 Tax=Gulosibacter massiliensis TaxID=2479839 RepID=UPI000F6420A3|nr:hypothetical protein [Gulosibacter massiliensis]
MSENTDPEVDPQIAELRAEAASWRKKLREQEQANEQLTAKVAELSAANESLTGESESLRGELDQVKGEQERAGMVAEVAKEYGVDAGVLRGSTRDEITAHAEQLRDVFKKANSAFMPNIGDEPGVQSNEEAEFVRDLFGS